jgi:hypothetical protein
MTAMRVLLTASVIAAIALTPPVTTIVASTNIIMSRATMARTIAARLRRGAPSPTPWATTVVSAAIVVRSRPPTRHFLGAHDAGRDHIPQHLLLQGDGRITGKDQAVVFL